MAEGFECYDETGKLQVNDKMLTYSLQRTGTATTVASSWPFENSYLKITGINLSDIVVLRNNTYAAGVDMNGVLNSGDRNFITNAPVSTAFDYFVFRVSHNTPSSSYGIEIRNTDNQITFSSNYRSLLAPAILDNVGRSSQPSYTAPGRSLAFAMMGYGGWKEYQNIDPDSGGYSYDHNWFHAGAKVTNSGQTITTVADIPSDYGRYFTPSGSFDFTNVYDVNCSVLIVDVTNIPIGVTFY